MKTAGRKKSDGTLKEDILQFALEQYGTQPEYLWKKYPGYAVLRREDNKKWYGVIMDLSLIHI